MAWFLCKQLILPNINHYRREGSWISDAKRLWKMVTIMRSIPDKSQLDKSSFTQLSRYWPVCSWPCWRSHCSWVSLPHLTLLAAVHVWQSHMLVCVVAYTLSTWHQLRETGCWSCIAAVNYSPKTRTVLGNNSHQSTIFDAMKRHCCCQHCFLRERMTRRWEWNRAMLYKEDYKRQNSFDKSEIWGHFQGDMKTIKVKQFVGGMVACCFVCPCEYDEYVGKIQTLSSTSGLISWHLSE